MNLSQLAAIKDAQTTDFTVTNPNTDEPLLVLVLAGPTHPVRVALARKYESQIAQAVQRSRDVQKAFQKQYVAALDPDERMERQIELLVTATVGWKAADGSVADQSFDAAAMEELYRAPDKEWLRRQVLGQLNADDAFTTSSPSK